MTDKEEPAIIHFDVDVWAWDFKAYPEGPEEGNDKGWVKINDGDVTNAAYKELMK